MFPNRSYTRQSSHYRSPGDRDTIRKNNLTSDEESIDNGHEACQGLLTMRDLNWCFFNSNYVFRQSVLPICVKPIISCVNNVSACFKMFNEKA